MEPRIVVLPERKLVGKRMKMSFSNNRTRELWQSFMPKRKEVDNNTSQELYSVEIYNDPLFFEHFEPDREFEKWAAIQVTDFDSIPDKMEPLKIPCGLYAVFLYKGKASEAAETYRYIFETWIPNSDYELGNRPHFAIMGEKYKNEDPNSEEELWIPIVERRDNI